MRGFCTAFVFFAATPLVRKAALVSGAIDRPSDRKVHLGAQAGEGVIEYAMDTQGTELDLITLQSRDAVKSFLNRDWLQGQLDEARRKAATP